jgi:hypothetical protein
MTYLRLFSILLVCFAAACGTRVSTVPLNAAPGPMRARGAEEVHLYTSGRPARNYHEVAMVEAQQESIYSLDGEETVFSKLRRKAGEMGCDGLIVIGPNDAVEGINRTTSTRRGYRGTCIVYQ